MFYGKVSKAQSARGERAEPRGNLSARGENARRELSAFPEASNFPKRIIRVRLKSVRPDASWIVHFVHCVIIIVWCMRLCQAIFQKLEFFHVARYEVCNSDHVDNLIGILGAGQKMDRICRNFGANRFSYSFGYCKRLANRKCEEV